MTVMIMGSIAYGNARSWYRGIDTSKYGSADNPVMASILLLFR